MKDRPTGGISEPKEPFAHEHAPMEDLLEIIRCEDNFFSLVIMPVSSQLFRVLGAFKL